jgi:CelD/BcsL family acetyltransferase involved in cellulose biosynthesis
MDPRELLNALHASRIDFCHMMADDETLARHAPRPDRQLGHRNPRRLRGLCRRAQGSRASGVLKDIDKKRRKAEREVGPCRFTAMSESRAPSTS